MLLRMAVRIRDRSFAAAQDDKTITAAHYDKAIAHAHDDKTIAPAQYDSTRTQRLPSSYVNPAS